MMFGYMPLEFNDLSYDTIIKDKLGKKWEIICYNDDIINICSDSIYEKINYVDLMDYSWDDGNKCAKENEPWHAKLKARY